MDIVELLYVKRNALYAWFLEIWLCTSKEVRYTEFCILIQTVSEMETDE